MAEKNKQTSSNTKKKLWIAAGVLVLLAALAETAATLLLAGPPASDEDWKKAAEEVRNLFQENDLLLFAPEWIDPTGRLHMGDLLDIRQVTRPDEASFDRIWVVGPRGKTRRETRNARLISRKRFGSIEASLYRNRIDPALFDFYKEISEAKVEVLNKDGSRAGYCPYKPAIQRHQCEAGWNNVRQKIAEVDYKPRRCVYAHPVDGRILEIAFPEAIMGSRLVVYTGLDGYDARYRARREVYYTLNPEKRKGRAPERAGPDKLVDVTMEILIGDSEPLKLSHPIDDKWRRHVLDTSDATGTSARVSFRIHTQWAYSKVFCFHAQTRK